MSSAEVRKKKRKVADQAIYEKAISAIACDLAIGHLLTPLGWLTVELSKSKLTPKTRRAPFMTEQFASLVKSLATPGADIIELEIGDQQSFTGIQSTMRASETFKSLLDKHGLDLDDFSRDPTLLGEPVELRSEKIKTFTHGKVAYIANKLRLPTDSALVDQMRREMIEINAWLSEAPLAWDGDTRHDRVDLGKRFLKRIFNNGSFEAGGRLYGGFWQSTKSALRDRNTLIDDQPVASLDFAQSALRMAYAQMGTEPPSGDLYGVRGMTKYRTETKKIINALLSSDAMPTRFPKGTRGAIPKSWGFDDAYSRIADYHAPIVPLFGSASGLRFMKRESDILIRSLLRLKSMGIAALPIHDCVLVARPHRSIAKTVMEESFYEVCGVLGVVEVEGSEAGEDTDGRVEVTEMHKHPVSRGQVLRVTGNSLASVCGHLKSFECSEDR